MSAVYPGGPHELGQNFLIAPAIIGTITDLVARTSGPIVELGPGDGALTVPLSRSGRPVTAVELDPRRARRLQCRVTNNVTVVHADLLRFRLPRHPHVVVANLPFHLTTASLKRLMPAPGWQTAILLVHWEVARRRAAVGGATLLTAQWWPWYEFRLHKRVPARSFRPVPAVDGGLLSMTRRAHPLVTDRAAYQRFVRDVFTGPGRGMRDILVRTKRIDRAALRTWLQAHGLSPHALPKDLNAQHWASLWRQVRGSRRAP